MGFYRRRLPHWHPEDAEFFITWRLYGSLPKAAHGAAPHGKEFVAMDRQLDSALFGPTWLANAQVAGCVQRALLSGESEWRLYELFSWVLMSNHVHVLLRPHVPLRKALMNVKSASARAANSILGQTGKHFWQDESYDHWVRDGGERELIVHYIHYNPVAAGLVAEPEAWPWSSAGTIGH